MAKASKGRSKTAASAAPAETPKSRAAADRGSVTPYTELRRQMDRLFDDFMHGWPSTSGIGSHPFDFDRLVEPLGLSSASSEAINVRFEVSESDDSVEITAELPGIDESDIDVTLDHGVMTIKGEKKAESEKNQKDYHLSERHYGSFVRSFRLPESVNEEKVKATFDKGVLAITLPKRAEAKRQQKKIAISKR